MLPAFRGGAGPSGSRGVAQRRGLFDLAILKVALRGSVVKLDPRV